MRKVSARTRTDGEKTRETLIDAAGRLAAKKGWANVTAKEVCDLAGVNTASINYWFGSRDKLYEAVLRRIPETIFSRELEIEMVQYETPEAALDCFFSYHLRNMDAENSWPMKVWAREVTGYPSEAFKALVQKEADLLPRSCKVYSSTQPEAVFSATVSAFSEYQRPLLSLKNRRYDRLQRYTRR